MIAKPFFKIKIIFERKRKKKGGFERKTSKMPLWKAFRGFGRNFF